MFSSFLWQNSKVVVLPIIKNHNYLTTELGKIVTDLLKEKGHTRGIC